MKLLNILYQVDKDEHGGAGERCIIRFENDDEESDDFEKVTQYNCLREDMTAAEKTKFDAEKSFAQELFDKEEAKKA